MKTSDGKPDLTVIDIKGFQYSAYYSNQFELRVKNIGTASLPGSRPKDLFIKIKRLFCPLVLFRDIATIDVVGKPFEPGDVESYYVTCPSWLGFYRCYFIVDPYERWDELNEDNNRVWTYAFLFGRINTPEPIGPIRYH
jgi:hypothetical protein